MTLFLLAQPGSSWTRDFSLGVFLDNNDNNNNDNNKIKFKNRAIVSKMEKKCNFLYLT